MNELDKIEAIKAVSGLGWVPCNEEVNELAIRPGMLYVFTDGTHYAIGDSDNPEELCKQQYFEPTHVALISKPVELPQEVPSDCVTTRKQATLLIKEETCPDCMCRQYPACSDDIPCCMCPAEVKSTCYSRQPCERKEAKR